MCELLEKLERRLRPPLRLVVANPPREYVEEVSARSQAWHFKERPGWVNFLASRCIGLLGGLIGLGGAEFRLPVLAGVSGYKARRAVALRASANRERWVHF